MNQWDKIAELLVKKVIGSTSPEEEQMLQEWIARSPKNREMFEAFMSGKSYVERKKNFKHLNYEKTIKAIHKKIDHKEQHRLYIRISAVAAVLLVAVLSAVIAFSFWNDTSTPALTPQEQGKFYALLSVNEGQKVALRKSESGIEWQKMVKKDAVNNSSGIATEEHIPMIQVEVPRGCEYWLRLNDSTEVWLNSETVLEYPERFAKDKREVSLKGEAFFKVKSDSSYPFEVRTDENFSIRVTGTELNVRNYVDEQYLKVTLIKGVVQVGNDSSSKVLSPSEQAIFDRETGSIQVMTLENPFLCVAWREGMFAFENESLEVIFAALAQWYDVKFVIGDREKIPMRSVTFHALRDERVEDLLGVLQSFIDFKFSVKGKEIYIYF